MLDLGRLLERVEAAPDAIVIILGSRELGLAGEGASAPGRRRGLFLLFGHLGGVRLTRILP